MSEQEDQQPEMRRNLLRDRMSAAASLAFRAPGALVSYGVTPLTRALEKLETAWISPSPERTAFAENLHGAGGAITRCFGSQGDLCRGEASGEPREVDRDDPHEGWKAVTVRIDARVSAAQDRPGGF